MTRYQILNALLHFLFFFIGAGIGSFLNVVIYRVPRDISVNNPRRSFCPSCQYQIPWYHNIPIFSWLFLRGKCANCKTSISSRYVGVELFTALVFYAVFWKFGGDWADMAIWGPSVLCMWVFMSFLIAGTFIDIEHFLLPDEITRYGTIAGVLACLWVPAFQGQEVWWKGGLMALASGAVGFGGLRAVVELGKLAFGRRKMRFEKPEAWNVGQPVETELPVITFGDEKIEWIDVFFRPTDRMIIACPTLTLHLDEGARQVQYQNVTFELYDEWMELAPMAGGQKEKFPLEEVKRAEGTATDVTIPREAMGLGDVHFMMMIGAFVGWKAVLFTLFAASILGTAVSMASRITGRAQWGSKLPFGPYLAAGAAIWVFYGPQILAWYLGKLGARPPEF